MPSPSQTQTSQSVTVPAPGGDLPAALVVPPQTGMDAANKMSETNGMNEASPALSRYPALLVLHDFYGLDDATRQAAERLSALGYVTLAPDVFASTGGLPQGETADDAPAEGVLLDHAMSLFDTRVTQAALAALESLAARDDVDANRVGIVGWGWGGAYALMAAAHDTRPRVAVDIGGTISYPALTPQKPGSPLNFVANLQGALFAAFAGADPLFPQNEIDRLRGRMIEHDKRGEVKIYHEAPPRFWRDPSLPSTAALWLRLENFLRDNLFEPENEAAFLNPQGIAGDGYPNEQSRLHA